MSKSKVSESVSEWVTRSPIELKKIIAVLAKLICNTIVQTTFWIGFERATSENPFDEVLVLHISHRICWMRWRRPDQSKETWERPTLSGFLGKSWVWLGLPSSSGGLHHFSVYSVIKLIGLEIVSLGQGKLMIMYHLTPIHRMGLPIQIGPSRGIGNMGNAFLVLWEQEFFGRNDQTLI